MTKLSFTLKIFSIAMKKKIYMNEKMVKLICVEQSRKWFDVSQRFTIPPAHHHARVCEQSDDIKRTKEIEALKIERRDAD